MMIGLTVPVSIKDLMSAMDKIGIQCHLLISWFITLCDEHRNIVNVSLIIGTSEEFSKILGFKEDRIKRLEAKVIQDKETDQLIRRFHTDKDFAADLVQKSVNALPEGKSEEVLKKLKK